MNYCPITQSDYVLVLELAWNVYSVHSKYIRLVISYKYCLQDFQLYSKIILDISLSLFYMYTYLHTHTHTHTHMYTVPLPIHAHTHTCYDFYMYAHTLALTNQLCYSKHALSSLGAGIIFCRIVQLHVCVSLHTVLCSPRTLRMTCWWQTAQVAPTSHPTPHFLTPLCSSPPLQQLLLHLQRRG